MRVVEVWLDDKFKDYFYTREPTIRGYPIGDISKQVCAAAGAAGGREGWGNEGGREKRKRRKKDEKKKERKEEW